MTRQETSIDPIKRAGIEIISLDAQKALASMKVGLNLQPYGLLHGGASAFLAESIASLAANEHAKSLGDDYCALGIELNISHHASVSASQGLVQAQALAIHLGVRIASYEVRITVGEKLISSARVTCLISQIPQ